MRKATNDPHATRISKRKLDAVTQYTLDNLRAAACHHENVRQSMIASCNELDKLDDVMMACNGVEYQYVKNARDVLAARILGQQEYVNECLRRL